MAKSCGKKFIFQLPILIPDIINEILRHIKKIYKFFCKFSFFRFPLFVSAYLARPEYKTKQKTETTATKIPLRLAIACYLSIALRQVAFLAGLREGVLLLLVLVRRITIVHGIAALVLVIIVEIGLALTAARQLLMTAVRIEIIELIIERLRLEHLLYV